MYIPRKASHVCVCAYIYIYTYMYMCIWTHRANKNASPLFPIIVFIQGSPRISFNGQHVAEEIVGPLIRQLMEDEDRGKEPLGNYSHQGAP